MSTILVWCIDLGRAVTEVTEHRDGFRNSFERAFEGRCGSLLRQSQEDGFRNGSDERFERDCGSLLQRASAERAYPPTCHSERSAVAKRARAVEEPLWLRRTSWIQ